MDEVDPCYSVKGLWIKLIRKPFMEQHGSTSSVKGLWIKLIRMLNINIWINLIRTIYGPPSHTPITKAKKIQG